MRWIDLAHPYHENVANLTAIAGRRLTVGAFPLRVRGGDGAPARIFAIEE